MSRRPTDLEKELENIGFDVEDDNYDPIMDDEIDNQLVDLEKGNQESILYYNNKKYAAGLVWLTENDVEDPELPRDRAKTISADFYCSRTFVPQSGFGFLKSGHRWGMPSIAAMAADALVGEWHGVFRADNRWLYVAVHADNIAPDGDILFLTENEAYNHFVAESARFKWPKSYIPIDWDIKHSDGEIHIEQIIEGMDPVILKPANSNAVFSGKSNKNIILLCASVFIGLILIFAMAKPLVSAFIPDRIADPTQNIEINNLVVLPPEEAAPETDPVTYLLERAQIPSPIKVLQSCMENFDSLMISIPGWNINKMRCRNNIVESIWSSGVGSLEILRSYIDQFPFRVNKTYGSNGEFLASTTINNFNDLNRNLELSQRQHVLLLLNRRFGGLGALQVRDVLPASYNKPNVRNIKNSDGQEEVQLSINDLPSLKAVLKTNISPIPIKENFNIPGLKFNGIEWDLTNNQWIYDMQIFLYPPNYKLPRN